MDQDTNYAYDIAMLCLKKRLQFSSAVLPVCLGVLMGEKSFNINDGAIGKVKLQLFI